jgi:hypothetical protein
MQVVENRAKLDSLKARAADLGRLATVVGWPGAGSPLHVTFNHKGVPVTTTNTVASVAAFHEFGSVSGSVPARPTMRTAIKLFKRDIPGEAAKIYKQFLFDGNAERSMESLGAFWEGRVKRAFTEGTYAALDTKTTLRARQRRGNFSTQPLVDYGHLRACVTHKTVGAGYQ